MAAAATVNESPISGSSTLDEDTAGFIIIPSPIALMLLNSLISLVLTLVEVVDALCICPFAIIIEDSSSLSLVET